MSFVILLIFALVCYGWGRCVSRVCYGKHSETMPAFEIGLGIAVLGAFGGLLNLFHLARPVSLYTLSVIGLALSLVFLRQQTKGLDWGALRPNLSYLPYSVVCLVATFFCINLIPTAALNHADDMHTYLVRPIRMIATGSVGGNPFDMLGLDSLGAQSFFQSFLLLVSPPSWANGFDAVFCFALSGFLILAIARQLKIQWYFSLLAVIAFVSINPQFVNISTLYSGTAVILASVIASSKLVDALQSGETPLWKTCLPLALLAATLLTLKNTLLFLLIVQLPLFFVLVAMARPLRKRALVAAAVTAAGMMLAILPWVGVTLSTYGIPGNWPGHDFAPTALMTKSVSLAAHDAVSLFKTKKLFYGGDQLTYTGIALGIALSGVVALFYRRAENLRALGPHVAPFAAAAFAAFSAYLLNAHMNDAPTAVRYSCPVFLAVFPVAGLILTKLFVAAEPGSMADAVVTPKPSLLRVVPVLAPLAVIVLFLPLSFTRFNQTLNAKSILAFPIQQPYLLYNRYATTVAAARVRALQDQTEPRQTILAWMAQPFHLDFKRNHVLNACDPGLVNPLLHFPAGVTDAELRHYLQSRGVRYVLHQFEGPGMLTPGEINMWLNGYPLHRRIAEYHLYLKDTLLKISETSRVLYRDEQIVLFDLGVKDEQIVTQR